MGYVINLGEVDLYDVLCLQLLPWVFLEEHDGPVGELVFGIFVWESP